MWRRPRTLLALCVLAAGCGMLTLLARHQAWLTGNAFIDGLISDSVPEIFQRVVENNSTTPVTTTQARYQTTVAKNASKVSKNATQVLRVELFPSWTTSDPKDAVFTRRVYLYSAFLALHEAPSGGGSYVDLVAFQEGQQLSDLQCCARIPGQATSQGGTPAIDFPPLRLKPNPNSTDLRVIGLVYRCRFSLTAQQLGAGHVTLGVTSCPADARAYLPVGVPAKRAGGLALCGKVAYGHELNARKLVEWFEVQRLLGVDKIVLYDLNNTETVRKVFHHYNQTGLLDPLPYKLPGRAWGRDMAPLHINSDDETLPIWDCRLRLAGYDYVMGIDMDEVILPRSATRLKPFFQEQFQKRNTTAALFFLVQFFVEEWGPVDSTAPLYFLQYLNSTQSRKECYKYVYIPSRTHQLRIHQVYSYRGYGSGSFLGANEAVIFHYRKCPHVWKSCDPPRITDKTMLKFQHDLVPRVQATLQSVGL